LAGGRLAFTAVEILRREGDAVMATVAEAEAMVGGPERLERLSAPRASLCGIPMDRPAIMGVVNVTPDSFSDGGDCADPTAAIARGRALCEAGADIIDVGGESTRPGADPVEPEIELMRVLPVVLALAADGLAVSIDSRRASVMAAALDAGAVLVNDVSALTYDSESLALVAARAVPVVLMHGGGDPKTMQDDPHYDCAPLDVFDYLEARVAACIGGGISRTSIVVDPGIGFGKSATGHNVEILQCLGLLQGLGCPVLLGVSRKSFIGLLGGAHEPKQRLPGSLAAGLAGLDKGVQILRVHDVAETAQALAVWQALAADLSS
jgi:dihydropteroate synthase